MLRGLLVLTALAVGGLLIAWFVANRSGPAHDETVEAARAVRTIEARLLPFRVRAHGFGVARPAEVWQAVANVQGRVVYRHDGLASGTLLPAGTLLLAIDPGRYELAIAEAEADLATLAAEREQLEAEADNTRRLLELERERLTLVEQELARIQRLAGSGAVSETQRDEQRRATLAQRQAVQSLDNQLQLLPSRRDRLSAQIERTSTRLARARRDLDDTRFVAPYDLRVGEVEIERHQFAGIGQRLFRAESIERAEVVAQVPLPMLRRLMMTLPRREAPGEALDISEWFDLSAITAEVVLTVAEDVTWPARVVRFANGLDPGTRTVQVVVAVDEPYRQADPPRRPALVRDMYVRVVLEAPAPEPLLAIPAAAVHQDRVHLVDAERRLERRVVDVAFRQRDLAVIDAGLSVGEHVVVDDVVPAVDGLALDPHRDEALEQHLAERAAGRAR